MKANELMLNDWVSYGRHLFAQITNLSEDMDCSDINPIPLTEEIQKAYERSIRSLRKYYKRLYAKDTTWMKGLYMHRACQPFFMMIDEVDDLWCVNN